jgi:lysylphosphatidylglycerol synthetase-like protein (DUF2156 family)
MGDYVPPMSTVRESSPEMVLTHPNREPASAKATRAFMIALLVASGVLLFVIYFGSRGANAGAGLLTVIIGLLYLYFAYLVSKWQNGILPVAAGMAIMAGIFAGVSVKGWFERGGPGYTEPPLPEDLIGVLIFGFAVLQLVVVVVSLRAFQQQWQVELEVPRDRAASGTPVAT